MKKNRHMERVIAEITLFHLIRLGNEHGCSVSREQAMAFLNEEERAQEMWNHMDASWSGLRRVQLISAVCQPGMVRKDARIHAACPRDLYPGVVLLPGANRRAHARRANRGVHKGRRHVVLSES